MLVSEMTTDILREWSESADDPAKTSLVHSWIRNALDDFAILTNFRVFYAHAGIVTVATVENYELPEAFQNIVSMRIPASDLTIEEIDRQQLLLSGANLETAGTPRFWFYVNSIDNPTGTAIRIQLYPVPNAIFNITISGVVHPAALVAADTIPVHNEHLNIIKDRVRWYMAVDDKDYDAADRHDAQFVRKAGLIVSRENKRPAQRRVLRVTDVRSSREEFVRPDPNHFSN